jgi:hypothetical protein
LGWLLIYIFLKNNLYGWFFETQRDFSTDNDSSYSAGISGTDIYKTPPLNYLFEGYRNIGGWSWWFSVLLTVGLTVCFHNTGAEQSDFATWWIYFADTGLIIGVGTEQKLRVFSLRHLTILVSL